MRRDIVQRAEETMPFLTFDHDPYLAVTDEGYVWIMDAYTTSDAYPYSQAVNLAEVTAELLPRQEVNYIRNSVKAVVDAYDGSVTYYADLDEPIMQAWNRAFPGVFTSIDEAPEEIRAHFRYPENLFQTQAFQFANYHVQDPGGVLPEAGLLGDPGRSRPCRAPGPSGRSVARPRIGSRGSCSRATSCCGCPGRPRSGSTS